MPQDPRAEALKKARELLTLATERTTSLEQKFNLVDGTLTENDKQR